MQDEPSANAALAANLRERALAVEEAGPQAGALLKTFDNPSWQDLHTAEQQQIDAIAEQAAFTIFGVRTRDRVTNRIAADLEQGAAYLVRRIHPEFVQAAHEQAVETLLVSDHFKSLTHGLTPAQKRLKAHWLATEMRAAFHAVMEARVPLAPAAYLKATAAATERGAR